LAALADVVGEARQGIELRLRQVTALPRHAAYDLTFSRNIGGPERAGDRSGHPSSSTAAAQAPIR
jgi:hypothetical protein